MKKNLFGCVIILFALGSVAQSSVKWQASIAAQKVFIENKSQFDGKDKLSHSPILFGTDESPVMIYFSKSGLSYSFTKTEFIHEEEKHEAEREEDEHKAKVTTDIVHMEWENSNPAVQVVPVEQESYYYSYSTGAKNINHVKAFKKLLYKELYPGIDVEYIFHPEQGIEYSFILHPGADMSQVKMKYSGTDRVSIDEKGKVHLATLFGDIIDHAPVTSYQSRDNASIPSKFIKSGSTISFELGSYDKSQMVIVDPWTLTPNMPNTNVVFYVKADSLGNAYIYGGDNPIRLQKYDPTGALVWTYNTPWTSGSVWFGALVTDRHGNSYITDGTGATCRKIDSSGAFVWSNSSANPPATSIEYWSLALNCDETQVYVGGSRHVPFGFDFNATVFKINMTNGSVSTFSNVAHKAFNGTPTGISEVRSMCWAPNGNLYYLTLDTVGGLTPALTFPFRRSSGYSFPYYMAYSSPSGSGQGQNNICANGQLLYTTDGETLHKRDITTGAILATATIPTGAANNNSGVAVDSCGNVYAGAQNRVVKYDANLTMITSVSVPEPVYDVSIGATGDVLACGHNFAVALAMSACKPLKAICQTSLAATTTQTNSGCSACSGTATANPQGGTGPFTYAWSAGAQTTQTATGLCAGSYTVTITDAASASVTAAATIIQTGSVTLNASSVNTSCGNNNGSATVNPSSGTAPYTFLWNTGDTSQSLTAMAAGTYIVTVTDATGCNGSDTTVINPSGNSPVSISAPDTLICSGDSAMLCAPSGYASYQWNMGQTTQCIYGKLAGNYYLTVTDLGNCTATSNHVAFHVYPLPPVSISVNGDTLTAYNAITYQWYLNGNVISGATSNIYIAHQTGDYTVAVSDSNGCIATSTKVNIVTTGVADLLKEEELKVYPNPLEFGQWTLEAGENLIGSEIEIFDAEGRLVFRSAIQSPKSEIELNAARGVYMMRVSSEKKTATLKLIKL
jgi:hypothetical protein